MTRPFLARLCRLAQFALAALYVQPSASFFMHSLQPRSNFVFQYSCFPILSRSILATERERLALNRTSNPLLPVRPSTLQSPLATTRTTISPNRLRRCRPPRSRSCTSLRDRLPLSRTRTRLKSSRKPAKFHSRPTLRRTRNRTTSRCSRCRSILRSL